jgi:hypothetical protein
MTDRQTGKMMDRLTDGLERQGKEAGGLGEATNGWTDGGSKSLEFGGYLEDRKSAGGRRRGGMLARTLSSSSARK